MFGGFQGGPQLGPLMPRDASLSDSYKSDQWRFSCLHWGNYISLSFYIEWDMIVVTVFLSICWTKWNYIWFRKSKGKLSLQSYPITCERKWKTSFLSANRTAVFGRPLSPLGVLTPLKPHKAMYYRDMFEGFQGSLWLDPVTPRE